MQENTINRYHFTGEEDGISANIGEERFTAFNMREEMDEGHFDKDGHFIWKNEKEVRDNWLDNIDWQKIKSDKNMESNSNDSENEELEPFQEIQVYKEILNYLKPNETINKALRRLGGKNFIV